MRVSIVATALDNQEPLTKPVVSMVHRIHNRNVGYSNQTRNSEAIHPSALSATEGATALDLNVATEQNEVVQQNEVAQQKELTNQLLLKNISIENATYLQNNMESTFADEEHLKKEDEIPNFEIDSIELANSQLFSDDEKIKTTNNDNKNEEEPKIFESQDSEKNSGTKEPEMFENSDLENDLEIPAFLRRQKN